MIYYDPYALYMSDEPCNQFLICLRFSYQITIGALKMCYLVNHGRRGHQSRGSGGSRGSQRSQASQKSQARTKRRSSSQSQESLFDDTADDFELSDHDIMKLRKHLLITLQVREKDVGNIFDV